MYLFNMALVIQAYVQTINKMNKYSDPNPSNMSMKSQNPFVLTQTWENWIVLLVHN